MCIYANIPDNLREDIIVVVDDKTYTWNTAYLEIKDKTYLAQGSVEKAIVIENWFWDKAMYFLFLHASENVSKASICKQQSLT